VITSTPTAGTVGHNNTSNPKRPDSGTRFAMRYALIVELDTDPKNIVGSIIKASRLLDTFSNDRREVFLADFVKETGYNKTTAYRLLQTMVSAGWLMRSSSGGYRLGMRVLLLGAIARADLDLRNEALPFMRQLAEEFGDTAFLMVPGPQGAVTIETVVGRNPVRVHGVTVGSVLPYHVAAGPVVIAAFSPRIEKEVLATDRVKLTPETTVAKAALRAKYAEARDLGYSVSVEDYIDDVAAVAAPVLDATGTPVAYLSVGGPANRFTDPLLSQITDRIVAFAKALSSRMNS
jgi:DNA-binding IclR family transcriptional regulator